MIRSTETWPCRQTPKKESDQFAWGLLLAGLSHLICMSQENISSDKQLAQVASDLTDHEIQQVFRIVTSVRDRYAMKQNTPENLEAMRDEVLTRLAEINVLATFDPTPAFYGEPPAFEILGKVSGDSIHKYGFDHERKQYEVIKSKERGEDYLGQRESYNKLKPRKDK